MKEAELRRQEDKASYVKKSNGKEEVEEMLVTGRETIVGGNPDEGRDRVSTRY